MQQRWIYAGPASGIVYKDHGCYGHSSKHV
jgi:hypothetical protein